MAVAVSVFEWESNALNLKDALARQEKLGFAMRGRDERLERPQRSSRRHPTTARTQHR